MDEFESMKEYLEEQLEFKILKQSHPYDKK
jgi:hypothetical protein